MACIVSSLCLVLDSRSGSALRADATERHANPVARRAAPRGNRPASAPSSPASAPPLGACNIGAPCPGGSTTCDDGKHATCETTLWHAPNDNSCIPSLSSGLDPVADAHDHARDVPPDVRAHLHRRQSRRRALQQRLRLVQRHRRRRRAARADLHVMLDCSAQPGKSVVARRAQRPRLQGRRHRLLPRHARRSRRARQLRRRRLLRHRPALRHRQRRLRLLLAARLQPRRRRRHAVHPPAHVPQQAGAAEVLLRVGRHVSDRERRLHQSGHERQRRRVRRRRQAVRHRRQGHLRRRRHHLRQRHAAAARRSAPASPSAATASTTTATAPSTTAPSATTPTTCASTASACRAARSARSSAAPTTRSAISRGRHLHRSEAARA